MAHFVVVSLVALGSISAFVIATLVVGTALVAHASAWFSDAKRGRPVPEPRTRVADLPPHSTPVNAM
jgi:hypothetical protein